MSRLKVLQQLTGGLSAPSKMPGTSYSISAHKCNVGGRLAKIPGSVCHGCYALKGRYMFPNVKEAHERRFQAWESDSTAWTHAMAEYINREAERTGVHYHRWFDSGDIQGTGMMLEIIHVSELTPTVQHWLPTKEYGVIKKLRKILDAGVLELPKNLCIRVSHPKVNGRFEGGLYYGFPTSMVASGEVPKKVFSCPAPTQNNECGDCRACWQPKVKACVYHEH